MKEKFKGESRFQKAKKAVQKVLGNPDLAHSEDCLTVIFFWDDLLKGFKAEIIYQCVSLSSAISSEKIVEFGEPPSLAGTRLMEGLDFAIKFLDGRQGAKIVKLITDNAADAQKAREENKFRLIERDIRYDCIIVKDSIDAKSQRILGMGRLGQAFEASDVDSIAETLQF